MGDFLSSQSGCVVEAQLDLKKKSVHYKMNIHKSDYTLHQKLISFGTEFSGMTLC